MFSLARIYETEGVNLNGELTAEGVRDHWAQITDEKGQQAYQSGSEQGRKIFRQLGQERSTRG